MVGLKNNLNSKKELINKINQLTFLNKEQWKYTNFNYLSNFNFSKNISYNSFSIKKNSSIEVLSINDLIKQKNKTYLKFFNKIIPQENKFILYNTTYFHNGYYFDINKNSDNAYAFIDNKITTSSKNDFSNDRMIFNFNKQSKSTIFLNEQNTKNIKNNSVYELYLDNDSIVDFIIHSNQPSATKILNLCANINKNATLNIYTINISGELVKNNYYINLNKKNSECNFNGIGLLNKKNHIDNFVGNIESRYFLNGDVDVVVCDGFTGNIILKLTEGIFKNLTGFLKESLSSSDTDTSSLMPILGNLKKKYDYEEHGGTPILGINGIVMKCHGSSSKRSIKNSIIAVKKFHDANLINEIADRMSKHMDIFE